MKKKQLQKKSNIAPNYYDRHACVFKAKSTEYGLSKTSISLSENIISLCNHRDFAHSL